jgi:hypothetical protein
VRGEGGRSPAAGGARPGCCRRCLGSSPRPPRGVQAAAHALRCWSSVELHSAPQFEFDACRIWAQTAQPPTSPPRARPRARAAEMYNAKTAALASLGGIERERGELAQLRGGAMRELERGARPRACASLRAQAGAFCRVCCRARVRPAACAFCVVLRPALRPRPARSCSAPSPRPRPQPPPPAAARGAPSPRAPPQPRRCWRGRAARRPAPARGRATWRAPPRRRGGLGTRPGCVPGWGPQKRVRPATRPLL